MSKITRWSDLLLRKVNLKFFSEVFLQRSSDKTYGKAEQKGKECFEY